MTEWRRLGMDRRIARRDFLNGGNNYQMSQVFRYHDTFPRPEGFPVWPEVLPEPVHEHDDRTDLTVGQPGVVVDAALRSVEPGHGSLLTSGGASYHRHGRGWSTPLMHD